jgi:hypothetical protein
VAGLALLALPNPWLNGLARKLPFTVLALAFAAALVACVAQVAAQVALAKVAPYGSMLPPGSTAARRWLQLGFARLDSAHWLSLFFSFFFPSPLF